MAFPKKGLRKITVNEIKYGYNITGNDGFISFSIGLLHKNGEILTGNFSYHEHTITNFNKDGEFRSWSCFPRIKITPDTIRQIIEYGLKNNWNPHENQGQLRLKNMDDKIQLNLSAETKFPQLKPKQVALNFTKLRTGHFLDLNMKLYLGTGDIYHVFNSIEGASNFAKTKIKENPEIECWIMTDKNKAVKYLSTSEEKEFEEKSQVKTLNQQPTVN